MTAVFGTVIGVLAGFKGGWLDTILMRVTDLFLAFPATIIAMAVAASLGPSMTSSMIGISVVWWPLYARLVRGEVRRLLVLPHVEAARMSGTKGVRLLTRHVLPAVMPTIAVTASLDIGGVILTLASLSFVGLRSPAPAPELGRMASEGMRYVLNAWWIAVFPGLIVGFLIHLNATTWTGHLCAVVVWTLGELVTFPFATTIVANLAPADLRATYQGVYNLIWSAAHALAPVVGGQILAHLGADWMWRIMAGVLVSAAVGLVTTRKALQAAVAERTGV